MLRGDNHTQSPTFKGNAQFALKETFEPLMDFKQNHYGSYITKVAYF